MGHWAAEWVFGDPTDDDCDGLSLIWRTHQYAIPAKLPEGPAPWCTSSSPAPGVRQGWLDIQRPGHHRLQGRPGPGRRSRPRGRHRPDAPLAHRPRAIPRPRRRRPRPLPRTEPPGQGLPHLVRRFGVRIPTGAPRLHSSRCPSQLHEAGSVLMARGRRRDKDFPTKPWRSAPSGEHPFHRGDTSCRLNCFSLGGSRVRIPAHRAQGPPRQDGRAWRFCRRVRPSRRRHRCRHRRRWSSCLVAPCRTPSTPRTARSTRARTDPSRRRRRCAPRRSTQGPRLGLHAPLPGLASSATAEPACGCPADGMRLPAP